MHYKNGRKVTIGDWVVGVSHNSGHKPIVGIVIEMMPDQGTCNIKLHRWSDESFLDAGTRVEVQPQNWHGKPDFGDAKEFILCEDGLRMVNAVLGHGNWDGPYL